jgi:cell division protein FtsB
VRYLTGFLLVVLVLLQYRLWLGDGGIVQLQRMSERIELLKIEADRRHDRNTALEAEVRDLKEGLDAVEERARQELGMVKEREVFIQVVEKPKEAGHSKPPRKKTGDKPPGKRPSQPTPGG